jgi:hypothetical protein
MTGLKILLALLGAAACLIPYLALTDEHERALASEARQGRVVEVQDDVVRYEIHDPGSQWDEDGDGWIGPYSDEGVPSEARAALRPGDAVVVRSGQLEQSLSPPTPLFLVGFVLCLLFGVWAIVGPILERRAIEAARSQPLRLIELMVKKTRTTQLLAAFFLFVMGGGLAALPLFLPEEEPLWQKLFIGGLGVIGLAVAALNAAGAWALRDPKNAPVLRAIRNEPQRIVWIYEHVVEVNEVPTYTLYVCRDDGVRYDFRLGTLRADALVESLAKTLPHAVLGYSRERERIYARSPRNFAENAAVA